MDGEIETNVDASDSEDDSQVTLSVSHGRSSRRLSASSISASSDHDGSCTHSPFVPDVIPSISEPLTAVDAESTGFHPVSAPPSFSAHVGAEGNVAELANPPSYDELSATPGASRRSKHRRPKRRIDASNTSTDSKESSADESSRFLPASQVSDGNIQIELQERQASRGGSPAPPPYDIALARIDQGIATRTTETTFSTPGGFTQDEERRVVGGRNEPPPDYPLDEFDEPRPDFNDDTDAASATRRTRHDYAAALSGGAIDVEASDPARTSTRGSSTSSVHAFCRSASTRKKAIIITSVVAFCLLMFVILFPVQFSYVNYYQFALVRTKSTGSVATDRVYEHGCFVLGADKEFVYLNRTLTSIELYRLAMFSRDNVAISIDVDLYYLLNYEQIGQLWRDYAGKHDPVILNVVKTAILNAAPQFSQNDYLHRREYVQQVLHDAVVGKLRSWGISIPFFNYLNLHLPQRVLDKRLQLLLIRTDIEKELAYQKQRKVELETELFTTPIIYKAKEAINNGTAEAAAIRTISKTRKSQQVEEAHSMALRSMMQILDVNRTDHALSFYYLATLNTMDHFAGAVGYSKRGLYTPKGT